MNKVPRRFAGCGRVVGDGAGEVGAESEAAAWMLIITYRRLA